MIWDKVRPIWMRIQVPKEFFFSESADIVIIVWETVIA